MYCEILREIIFLRYVTHVIARLVHGLHGVFLNTILQYFTGLYALRNGLYHALSVALKTSRGEKRINFVAVVAHRESLSPLSLLMLGVFFATAQSRGCVRLTNERNKLYRRLATSCIKRSVSRACTTTNEELQGGYVFISLIRVRITRREGKYDIKELYMLIA